jgi:KDO2-lipid IV(A) lauroyltransferase
VARGTIGGLYADANRYFNAHYVRTMQAFGGPVFPQGRAGPAGFVRHLKSGGPCWCCCSIRMCRAPRPALSWPAGADGAFGRRTGAALWGRSVPFYGIRQPDGLSFDRVLEAPIPPATPRMMHQALTQP